MPKRPAGLTETPMREQLVRRMEEVAERLGWSDAGLAHRVSQHRGDCVDTCQHVPMTAATIWKIKNADPPRRVDLDEANAIATGGFGYASLQEFLEGSTLQPLMAANGEAVRELKLMAEGLDRLEGILDMAWATLCDPAIGPVVARQSKQDLWRASVAFGTAAYWRGWMDLDHRAARVRDRIYEIEQVLREMADDVQ